jgi:FkbM family methyltransferase
VRPTALNSLYLLVYRAYLALKKSVIVPVFRRWPQGLTRFNDAKNFLKQRALPSRIAWVQVQSGFAQGLWMHLRIPEEAGFWRGEHEPGVQSAISALVRPGDVVYDVGAHLGSLALGAARLVGASGRVVAFDGDPENVERLRENSSRNHLNSRVQAVHAAVWSHRSASGISFRRGKSQPSQGGVESDGQRPVLGDGEIISVPVTTLDDFVAAGGPVPQLVKIDVEGGEYEVLRGGATLFANQRPPLLVEVHHQQAADKIGAWLNEFRYSAEWRIPTEKFPRYLIAWPIEHAAPALLNPDGTQ